MNKRIDKTLIAIAVLLSPCAVFAESVMDSTATAISTAVAGAITAGLVVFAAIATIRYVVRAFKAASKG